MEKVSEVQVQSETTTTPAPAAAADDVLDIDIESSGEPTTSSSSGDLTVPVPPFTAAIHPPPPPSPPPPDTHHNYTPDAVYSRLITEAPYQIGDPGATTTEPHLQQPPRWLNVQLMKEGQDFVRSNFFSIIIAHLGALLYGFSFKSLSTVLLRTGSSADLQSSTVRYLSTFIHLKTWYESDVVGVGEKGFCDIQRVRKLHSSALRKYARNIGVFPTEAQLGGATRYKTELIRALHADLAEIQLTTATGYDPPTQILTYFPVVPMSQFDMVMTQFGVCSLVYLFPESLGIRNLDGLPGFLHLWAVIGYLLGIDDSYNIALYPNRELYLKIFKNIGIASLKETDLAIITLQKSLVDGVAKYGYNLCSVKASLYFGLKTNKELIGFTGREMWNVMSWLDVCYYYLIRTLMFLLFYCEPLRWAVNAGARTIFRRSVKIYLKK